MFVSVCASIMPMCRSKHVCMHVVAESTEAAPVLHWHSLNSISMLDLTPQSVCLLPLTRGAPVSAPAAVTPRRQRADRDRWNCSRGSNEKVAVEKERARERREPGRLDEKQF